MHVRLLLAVAALAALPLAAGQARDLTIVARGQEREAPLAAVLVKPFSAATGIAAQTQSWGGGMDALTQRAKTPDPGWDVVQVRAEELLAGCDAGLFEKLDWSQIGGKDHYLPIAVSDCGVGAVAGTLVLSWDRDKFTGTPSWADFWDVAKYPGKRGLRHDARGNLEIALLADGVAPGDIYKTLSSNEGVERAFRKLDQIKPYIVWWESDADAAKILSSGGVLMTSAPADVIALANRAEHRNFGVQWTASLYGIDSWVIPHGSPNSRQALQFLYFAGSSAIEARLVAGAGTGGFAKGANEGLPPELLAQSPTAPANMNAGLRIDGGFWRDNHDKLRQRFEAWLAAH